MVTEFPIAVNVNVAANALIVMVNQVVEQAKEAGEAAADDSTFATGLPTIEAVPSWVRKRERERERTPTRRIRGEASAVEKEGSLGCAIDSLSQQLEEGVQPHNQHVQC